MMSQNLKVNVSAVILNQNNEILVIKRSLSEDVFPGLWGIPGGTVEVSDSSLEAALQREIKEEVGILVDNIKIIQNNIRQKGDTGTLYIVYRAIYVSGTVEALDGTDFAQWIKEDTLSTLEFTPNTELIIRSVFETS